MLRQDKLTFRSLSSSTLVSMLRCFIDSNNVNELKRKSFSTKRLINYKHIQRDVWDIAEKMSGNVFKNKLGGLNASQVSLQSNIQHLPENTTCRHRR